MVEADIRQAADEFVADLRSSPPGAQPPRETYCAACGGRVKRNEFGGGRCDCGRTIFLAKVPEPYGWEVKTLYYGGGGMFIVNRDESEAAEKVEYYSGAKLPTSKAPMYRVTPLWTHPPVTASAVTHPPEVEVSSRWPAGAEFDP